MIAATMTSAALARCAGDDGGKEHEGQEGRADTRLGAGRAGARVERTARPVRSGPAGGDPPGGDGGTGQAAHYERFYGRWRRLRWLFRFDVHYRCHRLREVAALLDLPMDGARVLDVGFGAGHLLRCFPRSCRLHGADVSRSAVEAARGDSRFEGYREARFTHVPEARPEAIPEGPFDVVLSSHTLEHVPDDAAHLRALRERLRPGGFLLLFVPVEEPGYNPDHVRCYSLDSAKALVRGAGLDLRYAEGSMQVNSHVWKLLTVPSRGRWPVLGKLADALRLGTLSLLPHPVHLALDQSLAWVGLSPRQAFLVAQRPALGP